MTKIFNKIREELIALVILIPLAVVLGLILLSWSSRTNQIITNSSPPPPTVTILSTPISSPALSLSPTEISAKPAPTATVESQSTINLQIDTGTKSTATYDIVAADTRTVLDLLNRATRQGLTIEVEDYGSSLGVLVTALNGQANDNKKNMYWYLYVNGQITSTGASNVKVVPGDTVEWRYEALHNDE